MQLYVFCLAGFTFESFNNFFTKILFFQPTANFCDVFLFKIHLGQPDLTANSPVLFQQLENIEAAAPPARKRNFTLVTFGYLFVTKVTVLVVVAGNLSCQRKGMLVFAVV